MSMARIVIMAVVLEGRTRSEVAREYGLSRRWVQKLVARYRVEGEAAFEPRSRRPRSNPRSIGAEVEDAIVALRKQLIEAGHDAGAETIAWHMREHGLPAPAVATIWRVLRRRGFVIPQPHKRPRSSWRRFVADLPNEVWQVDITHWRLANGREVEILNIEDDHSRLLVGSTARTVFKAGDIVPTCTRPSPTTAARNGYSPTTVPCSPAPTAATAGSPWNARPSRSALRCVTPGPTTRRPAERWSGFTKR